MDNETYFETEMMECPSCGDHHWLIIVPLDLPEEEAGHVFTHYALCPLTGEEILLQLTQD